MQGEQASLSPEVGGAFFDRFQGLTKIQSESIPHTLAGTDTVLISGTGTGKTEAVLAPLVQRYLLPATASGPPRMLYIVPTKALANDARRRIEPRLVRLGLRLGLRHGDESTGLGPSGCDLLLTTPESLDVLLSRGDDFLSRIRAVVVDEAHLLFNTQRGMQLAVLLRRLQMRTQAELQITCMSATVADGHELYRFFTPGRAPGTERIVQGDTTKKVRALVRILQTEADFIALIDKIGHDGSPKALVFTNSRRECDHLVDLLHKRTSFGEHVYIHYSSLSTERRLKTEKAFLEDRKAICIATSTLELGIDIGDIDLVILHGLPSSCESFLQRTGRGSRRAEESQLLCLVPWDDPSPFLTAAGYMALLRMAHEGDYGLQPCLAIYGAAVQQILSILKERGGRFTRLADIAEILAPWQHLPRSVVDEIADSLVAADVCKRHGFKNQISASDVMWRMESLRLLWGNFPIRSKDLPLKVNGRDLGNIPAANGLKLSPGTVLRFAGKKWRVQRVTSSAIEVEPTTKGDNPVDVSYGGTSSSIDPTLLDGLRRTLTTGNFDTSILADRDRARVSEGVSKLREWLLPASIPHSIRDGLHVYITFAGRLMNSAIGEWAGASAHSADDYSVTTRTPIEFSRLPSRVEEFQEHVTKIHCDVRDRSLFQSLLPDQLRNRELIEPWLRVSLYQTALERLSMSVIRHVPLDDLVSFGFTRIDPSRRAAGNR